MVSTSERQLRFPSLLARVLSLPLHPGDLDWDHLSVLQRQARAGHHAAWTTGFVRWVASQLDVLRARLVADVQRLRPHFSTFEIHPRTVDALSQLAAVIVGVLCPYLIETRALSVPDTRAFVGRCQDALDEVARQQARCQLQGDSAKLFVTVLHQLLDDGRVRLVDANAPDENSTKNVVGWKRNHEVWVDPITATDAVRGVLGTDGCFDVSERQLGGRLRAAGLLLRVDTRGGRVRFSSRVRIAGVQRRVWVFQADTFSF